MPLKLAIFSREVSRQLVPGAVQGAGHRDALSRPRGPLANLPVLKEMRARLEETGLRVGGRGSSSGQQIKRQVCAF